MGQQAQLKKEILERNMTHKYNPDCSYLDDWEKLGAITFLKSHFETGEDWDESSYESHYIFFQGFTVVKEQDIREAFYDHFRAGCSCSHDCCGHATGGAFEVEKFDFNIWKVVVRYSPNY